MFSTKRNKRGDIIVAIDLRGSLKNGVKSVLRRLFLLNRVYRALNAFCAHFSIALASRLALLAVAGIGLGFGFSVALFGGVAPVSAGLAQPLAPLVETRATVEQLTLVETGLSYPVAQTERFADFYLWPSNELVAPAATTPQQARITILFAGRLQQLTEQQQDFALGDRLELVRSNNGRYSYQVISIKTLTRQTLQTLYLEPAGTVAVVFPKNTTQTQFLVVLAR